MSVLKISEENFEEEVMKTEKTVILDFYADWCGPCKMMSPIIDGVAEELGEEVKVGKVNTDENLELAQKFNIEEVHQGIRIKIDVLKNIIEKYSLSKDEFVYIGDDINDLECLEFAKYKLTVEHAPQKIKQIQGIQVIQATAGNGAFREVADCLTN